MDPTPDRRPETGLAEALDALVARGTITAEQRGAVLAEVAGGTAASAAPAPLRSRRPLSEVLVEVGLYVGSALVLAAGVVLVAQNWEQLDEWAQVGLLVAVAVVTAVVGWVLALGAADGSARRRLAGVVLTATAATAAGAVALALGDTSAAGVAALGTAVAILVVAELRARSAVTEIGLFVASFALLNVAGDALRPDPTPRYDEFGNPAYDTTTYDRVLSMGGVLFGAAWALLVARWVMHRELAVALGAGAALAMALPLAGESSTRPLGLVALALLAVLGLWRFMAEGFWPWLVLAIVSVTASVFWVVGGARRPVLAILVAGLVLLAASALGLRAARRRRALAGDRAGGP